MALLSVPRLVSTIREAAGEESNPWGTGLVKESVVVKVGEGNGVEAGDSERLAVEDAVASPGLAPVLEDALPGKAAELALGTRDAANEVMAPEGSISVLMW